MRIESVLNIFEGELSHRTAIIIGGGFSVKSFDFKYVKSHWPVIGVNDAFKLGDFIDFIWFGDQRWYEWNRDLLIEQCKLGRVYTCAESIEDDPMIRCFKRGKPLGIETSLNQVSWNRASGASAINFSYHLGARKIILIGFDLKRGSNGETHWHDYHKTKDKDIDTLFLRYLEPFKKIKEDADKLGIEIINVNPDSAIQEFPKMSIKEALE